MHAQLLQLSPRPKAGLASVCLLFVALALSSSCGGKSGTEREVMVFAAASLTDVFDSIAAEFEQTHPGIHVQISYAGSQSLRTQIENGASPDLFASANAAHLQALEELGLVEKPITFAENQMVIVIPKSNPAKISHIKDLPRAQRIVLAGEAVPAGIYAEQVLTKASADLGTNFSERVHAKVVSHETHVRQTLQKIILGEADAAIVYATDAASTMENIGVVPIPEAYNVRAVYPVAALKSSKNPAAAEFIDFLRSKMGREKLQLHGFVVP